MNNINFAQAGGFPFETEALSALQIAYSLFNSLGAIIGDKSIVKGCVVSGSNTGDGVIYLNGELIEFRGGTTQSKIVIKEESTLVEFEDGSLKPTYYTRYATFGTGTEAINWTDFKRVDNLIALVARVKNIEDTSLPALQDAITDIVENGIPDLQEQINALNAVPVGIISMWAGAVDAIPNGWYICDGANGTPDLIGRFIVGFDPDNDDNDYNAIGNKGGVKTVPLTEAQMPSHNHSASTSYTGSHNHYVRVKKGVMDNSDNPGGGGEGARRTMDSGIDYNAKTQDSGSHSHSVTVNSKGGGEAHENRPPYYTLAYIQFKGI